MASLKHSKFITLRTDGRLLAKLNTALTARQRETFGLRLLKLGGYLKALKPGHYNHDSLVEEVNLKEPCGSVCCAFGHAVVSGQFPGVNVEMKPRFGTTWRKDEAITETNIRFETKDLAKAYSALKRMDALPHYIESNLDADSGDMELPADAYFGPGAWQAIFDLEAYPSTKKGVTRNQVVKRIENVARLVYGVTP